METWSGAFFKRKIVQGGSTINPQTSVSYYELAGFTDAIKVLMELGSSDSIAAWSN
jgi:hypothetical protein